METKEFFSRCLEQASSVVDKVSPDDMTNDTPDDEWDVKRLLNHMAYELSWIPEMLSGKTIQEIGDKYDYDLSEGDYRQTWSEAANKAKQAVDNADPEAVAHLSYADVKNEDYMRQVAGELLIHAWDLSKGINKPLEFNPELAQTLYEQVKSRAEDMHRSGLFKPIVETDDNADLQTKLLALYGRDGRQ